MRGHQGHWGTRAPRLHRCHVLQSEWREGWNSPDNHCSNPHPLPCIRQQAHLSTWISADGKIKARHPPLPPSLPQYWVPHRRNLRNDCRGVHSSQAKHSTPAEQHSVTSLPKIAHSLAVQRLPRMTCQHESPDQCCSQLAYHCPPNFTSSFAL